MDKIPHILIVEDNEDHYEMIRAGMEEGGHAFTHQWLRDGAEVMKHLQAERLPDLILLDLNIPRYDGREMLRSIKRSPRLCRIPIIILTTSHARTDVNLCYELGANAYLRKPAGYDELADCLDSLARFWFRHVELPQEMGEKSTEK